ncbi:MAG: hypothetical protein ACYC91_06880 [Solirubrobacteraceae bacterium]
MTLAFVALAVSMSGAAVAGVGASGPQIAEHLKRLDRRLQQLSRDNVLLKSRIDRLQKRVDNLSQRRPPSTALAMRVDGLNKALSDLKSHVGGTDSNLKKVQDGLSHQQRSLTTGNVIRVVKELPLPQNGSADVISQCPSGYQVLGGGYAQGALYPNVIIAGPIQSTIGYELKVLNSPGVGSQTTSADAVAYCAPVGRPVVFGAKVPRP